MFGVQVLLKWSFAPVHEKKNFEKTIVIEIYRLNRKTVINNNWNVYFMFSFKWSKEDMFPR